MVLMSQTFLSSQFKSLLHTACPLKTVKAIRIDFSRGSNQSLTSSKKLQAWPSD